MKEHGIKRLGTIAFSIAAALAILGPKTVSAQSIYEPYTFTTLAGSAGQSGSADGIRSDARFSYPHGIAVDGMGNLYVADSNSTIRKVSPNGAVTTLAGLAGSPGSADGTGAEARFRVLIGIAVDQMGNVYGADYINCTIRKVSPAGMVTTLAGLAGSEGSADGTGSAAQFKWPIGIAVDQTGNVYVADNLNFTIRKVTPEGVVTTLAGLAGSRGSADGTGSAARFQDPYALAVDSEGNIYVADAGTIRKVTAAGVVTAIAGSGEAGTLDGPGVEARFYSPKGVAVDRESNLYVADFYTIRKVTPDGFVTTLAGLAPNEGTADRTGITVRFTDAAGVAVDSAGNLYVADTVNQTLRKGWPTHLMGPAISLSPVSQTALVGSNVTFLVIAAGTALNYQWLFEGTPISGQTNASLSLPNVRTDQSGLYAVVVSNQVAVATSPAASLAVVQQLPVEVQFRAALEQGGTVEWQADDLIAVTQTIRITHDTVLDGTGHSMTIDGQNQVRLFTVSSNAHLTLLNVTLTNGLADQGGAIYNEGGTLSLSDCIFTVNQAFGSHRRYPAARGGAIYSVGGEIAATNCLFASNAAIPAAATNGTVVLEARGGALGIENGMLRLLNCQFTTNQASGGLQYSPFVGPGSIYSGAKGSAFGGAVCLINSTGNVSGCRFDHNIAQSPLLHDYIFDSGADVLGGALHQEGVGQLHLLDCAFVENQALGGDCGRDGRTGDGCGGAVSTYGNLVAERCSFQGNACFGGHGNVNLGGSAFGGALFTINTATLKACLFSANWAHASYAWYIQNGNANGGAVYAEGALQILNTSFAANWVEGQHVTILPSLTPSPGNSAGGALFSRAVCVTTNSTWFQNHADAQPRQYTNGRFESEGTAAGAAIYQAGNSLALSHCTIASNAIVSVTNTAAAITVETNAIAQLSACLLSGNLQGSLAGNIEDQGFNLSSDHSILFTNATSRNDIDPKLGGFGDHGGPTLTLSLLADSPAIDAITSGPCPATDQRGFPRPSGAGCDIGAFEFVPFVANQVLTLSAQGILQIHEVLWPLRDYQIDVSTNLVDWTLFTRFHTDEFGVLEFSDNTVTGASYRFYRVTPKE